MLRARPFAVLPMRAAAALSGLVNTMKVEVYPGQLNRRPVFIALVSGRQIPECAFGDFYMFSDTGRRIGLIRNQWLGD